MKHLLALLFCVLFSQAFSQSIYLVLKYVPDCSHPTDYQNYFSYTEGSCFLYNSTYHLLVSSLGSGNSQFQYFTSSTCDSSSLAYSWSLSAGQCALDPVAGRYFVATTTLGLSGGLVTAGTVTVAYYEGSCTNPAGVGHVVMANYYPPNKCLPEAAYWVPGLDDVAFKSTCDAVTAHKTPFSDASCAGTAGSDVSYPVGACITDAGNPGLIAVIGCGVYPTDAPTPPPTPAPTTPAPTLAPTSAPPTTPKYAKLTYISACNTFDYQYNQYYQIGPCMSRWGMNYVRATLSGTSVNVHTYTDAACTQGEAEFASYTQGASGCTEDAFSKPYIGDITTGIDTWAQDNGILGVYSYTSCAVGGAPLLAAVYFAGKCVSDAPHEFFRQDLSSQSISISDCSQAEGSVTYLEFPGDSCTVGSTGSVIGGIGYCSATSYGAVQLTCEKPLPVPPPPPPVPTYAKLTYISECNTFDYQYNQYYQIGPCMNRWDLGFVRATLSGSSVVVNQYTDSACTQGEEELASFTKGASGCTVDLFGQPFIGDITVGIDTFGQDNGILGAYTYTSCEEGGAPLLAAIYFANTCVVNSPHEFFRKDMNMYESISITHCNQADGVTYAQFQSSDTCAGTPTNSFAGSLGYCSVPTFGTYALQLTCEPPRPVPPPVTSSVSTVGTSSATTASSTTATSAPTPTPAPGPLAGALASIGGDTTALVAAIANALSSVFPDEQVARDAQGGMGQVPQ